MVFTMKIKVALIFTNIFVISTSKYVSIHNLKKIGGVSFRNTQKAFQIKVVWCKKTHLMITLV